MKYSVSFLVSNVLPLLIKFMKHFSIIIPQIVHCECRNPVIPFNSNLLCIQHHIYLTLQVMDFLKNQWYLISLFMPEVINCFFFAVLENSLTLPFPVKFSLIFQHLCKLLAKRSPPTVPLPWDLGVYFSDAVGPPNIQAP